MAYFNEDFLSEISRTARAWSRVLALVPVLAIASTCTASAQFGIDTGRTDGPGAAAPREGTRDKGMRGDGMRSGIGTGIGIGIDVGRAIIDKPADDAGKTPGAGRVVRSRSQDQKKSKRAAKKDDKNAPVPANAPKTPTEQPPTPVQGETTTGTSIDGGSVHRGTGAYGDRNAIFCWVTKDKGNTDKDRCTDYKEYQSVTVNAKVKWGDGAEQDVNAALNAKHKKGIESSTGSTAVFGELSADGHPALAGVDSVDLPNPNGNPVSAPPYRARKIPGTRGRRGTGRRATVGQDGGRVGP